MKVSVVRHFKLVRNRVCRIPAYNKLANKNHNLKVHNILARQENRILREIRKYADAADYLLGAESE